jgi:hypothetical protein
MPTPLLRSPAPNFGAATAPGAEVAKAPQGTPAASINFLVKPDEKRKYDALFDQLKPVGGLLPGDKVRNVMLGSKLPMSMLGKIWDLADQDKDGSLDRCSALHCTTLHCTALHYTVPQVRVHRVHAPGLPGAAGGRDP